MEMEELLDFIKHQRNYWNSWNFAEEKPNEKQIATLSLAMQIATISVRKSQQSQQELIIW